MTNAQLKAIRDLAHAQHDAGAANVVAIIRTDRGFEVRKGGKTVDIATTWEGANELASFL
jgi:hypothetical protein